MIGIVIVTHGRLAQEIISAMEHMVRRTMSNDDSANSLLQSNPWTSERAW
jgi:mannose/fructose-specific phosphotransferase system component IIA